MTKRLNVNCAPGGYTRVRGTASHSGNIDLTFKLKPVRRVNASPQYSHVPHLFFASDAAMDLPLYRVELLPDASQLARWDPVEQQYDFVADFFGTAGTAGYELGTEYTLRLQMVGNNIWFYRNGVLQWNYTDGAPYTSGYIGWAGLEAQFTLDDISGTLTQDFEALTPGIIPEGTASGNLFVVNDGDSNVTIENTAPQVYTLTALTRSYPVTAQPANVKAARKLTAAMTSIAASYKTASLNYAPYRRLDALKQHLTLTGIPVKLALHRRLAAVPRAIAVAGQTVYLGGKFLTATPRSVPVTYATAKLLRSLRTQLDPYAFGVGAGNLVVNVDRERKFKVEPMAMNVGSAGIQIYVYKIGDMKQILSTVRMDEVQFVVDPDGFIVGVVQSAGRVSYFPRTTGDSAGQAYWYNGEGNPEGVVHAKIGSMYTRTDGAPGATLYIKETGDGTATGWVAK